MARAAGPLHLGLTLVLAGALGNLIDRLLLGHDRLPGLSFTRFAIFNLADVYVTLGGLAAWGAPHREARVLAALTGQGEGWGCVGRLSRSRAAALIARARRVNGSGGQALFHSRIFR